MRSLRNALGPSFLYYLIPSTLDPPWLLNFLFIYFSIQFSPQHLYSLTWFCFDCYPVGGIGKPECEVRTATLIDEGAKQENRWHLLLTSLHDSYLTFTWHPLIYFHQFLISNLFLITVTSTFTLKNSVPRPCLIWLRITHIVFLYQALIILQILSHLFIIMNLWEKDML